VYIISRILKFEKGKYTTTIEKLKHKSPLLSAQGFVKRDILLDDTHKDFDILRIMVYFTDIKAFYKWEGSPEHIQMHRQAHTHKEPVQGLIERSKESYNLLESTPYAG